MAVNVTVSYIEIVRKGILFAMLSSNKLYKVIMMFVSVVVCHGCYNENIRDEMYVPCIPVEFKV